jgi:murein DD-endopeptidase MepM/ murein hydrolase activator NlpD
MSPAEFKHWTDEVGNHRPTFVSVFRAGVTRSDVWNHFKNLVTLASETITLPKNQTQAALVQPGGPGYSVTAYPPQDPNAGWIKFIDDSGHMTHARNTSRTQTLYASYLPGLTAADRYAVETYIPDEHATTHSANYFVVYYENGQRKESHVVLRQIDYKNAWVPLGFFQLDPRQAEAGRVNLLDLTADAKTREIAFSAIRWRPVASGGPGFDAPVGTPEERASAQLWPGKWLDANPYGSKYSLGYHTGSDLNLNYPFHNADKDQPVYAIADGVVRFARVIPETWGGLIVINHGPLSDGSPVFARYAHVANILVKEGDPVKRGQQIAQVGLFGKPEYANYHLHFDISTTNLLGQSPRDWPAENLAKIKAHYVDPKEFIEDHRP